MPESDYFLPEDIINFIESRYKKNQDWKTIVKQILLRIYGEEIINRSALGKRNGRPGIDGELFTGLYGES